MNRNVESHFAKLPSIDIQRSIFDRSFDHKTSMNVGDLIPFYVEEVLPGDTFRVSTSKVVRLQTLLTPVMDNLYLDTYFFMCPDYLLWDHAKEFFGENNSSAWVPQVEYSVPVIVPPQGGFASGTIADYMGLPIGIDWLATDPLAPSALPLRAYAMIANEFFRSEDLTDPLNIPTGDSNQTGSNGSSYINDVANGGMPFKVAKYHDLFTSCLPSAQKATNPVTFPLISGNMAPVVTSSQDITTPSTVYNTHFKPVSGTFNSGLHSLSLNVASGSSVANLRTSNSNNDSAGSMNVFPSNLWADLSTSVGAVSINQLRLAFQLQKFYEKNARGGTRYTELIKSHFGVTAPDSRLHRPEYLGGNRIPVTIHEVTNNAQSQTDFLGDLGAMSCTTDIHDDFTYSSVCHGYIIGVCCLRYDHSYPQGLERFWMRKKSTDFYFPVFANIGEQPVYSKEIFLPKKSTAYNTKSVFGYQEAWAEYRYTPDRLSGAFLPGTGSLIAWTYADNVGIEE